MTYSQQNSPSTPGGGAQPPTSSGHRLAGVIMLLGAVVLWVSSRFTWVTVLSEDDKAGAETFTIDGARWSAEITVCALVVLVAGAAVFFLGTLGRRIIGIVTACVAVFALISPLTLLFSGGDPDHARLVLASDTSSSASDSSSSLHSWAVVSSLDTAALPIVCAVIALALVLAAAVLVIWRPGRRQVGKSRFQRREPHKKARVDEWADEPGSGRALWDALDSGEDPTVSPSAAPDSPPAAG